MNALPALKPLDPSEAAGLFDRLCEVARRDVEALRAVDDAGAPESVRNEVAKLGSMLATWLKRRGINPVDIRASELLDDAVGALEQLADHCDNLDREEARRPFAMPVMDAAIREDFRQQGLFVRSTGAAEVLR